MIIIGRTFDKTRLPTTMLTGLQEKTCSKGTNCGRSARFIHCIILNMPQTIWIILPWRWQWKRKLLCIWLTCNILLLRNGELLEIYFAAQATSMRLFFFRRGFLLLAVIALSVERECWHASSPQIFAWNKLVKAPVWFLDWKRSSFFLYKFTNRLLFLLLLLLQMLRGPSQATSSGCGFPRQSIR